MEVDIDVEENVPLNEDIEIAEPIENEASDEISALKESPNQKQRIIRLPLSRIKTIMKLDPDCILVSQDSVFLVTKATVRIVFSL